MEPYRSSENIINSQEIEYILDSLQNEDDKTHLINTIMQNDLDCNNIEMGHVKPPFTLETESTCRSPSIEEYPGFLNFSIKPDDSVASTWEYSKQLGTLFIDVNKALRMRFSINNQYYNQHCGLHVRAVAVYTDSDSINDPVNRCPFHIMEDDPQSLAHHDGECDCAHFNYVGHVVRADMANAIYCHNRASERHSVLVPLSLPQSGDTSIIIPYMFTCKTSCARGMNRRMIHVVFTLEDSKFQVVGRRLLTVKICSCPKRDMKRLEKDHIHSEVGFIKPGKKLMTYNLDNHHLAASPPPAKKICLAPTPLTIQQQALIQLETLRSEVTILKENAIASYKETTKKYDNAIEKIDSLHNTLMKLT